MDDLVKFLPNDDEAAAITHPETGEALTDDGAHWPLDTFTSRLLLAGLIRKEEVEVAPVAEAKRSAAKAKA